MGLTGGILGFIGTFEMFPKRLHLSARLSLLPYATTRLTLDAFLGVLFWMGTTKISRIRLSFVNIRQKTSTLCEDLRKFMKILILPLQLWHLLLSLLMFKAVVMVTLIGGCHCL
jgi:hypothetical protein